MDNIHSRDEVGTQPSHYPATVITGPFPFLQLPKEMRLQVLKLLLTFDEPVWIFRPDILLAWSLSPFPDEHIALRATSSQMKKEADYVFMCFNHFFVPSLSDLTFLGSKANEFFRRSLQHIILGQNVLVITQLEELLGHPHRAFHTTSVLAALRKFPLLQTLKITLPWEENGLSNPDFGDLMDFLVVNVTTKKLIITRPDIEFLIPGNTGHPQESSIPLGSELSFFVAIVREGPRGCQYPINTLGILSNDINHVRRINDLSQSLGRELRLLPSRAILRLGNWLNRGLQLPTGRIWEPDLIID
ncbi:hypothetical protein MMC11_004820 [Xylographa trunciseda]|nr:hypothetical protein [Xylographa trunciseda]